jgi:signal transduction histidine kinase/DNA-binding NarL/FixJ family response regulator
VGLTRRQAVYLALIVSCGAGLAAVLHVKLQDLHARAIEAELALAVQTRTELLRSSWLRSLEALHATVDYLEVTPDLGREGFRRFASAPLARLPELQAVEWIPRVPRAERARYESLAAADGYLGYRFNELAPDGRLRAATDREEYFPVYYAEPPDGNLPALGLDLGAHPLRRVALDRARDTGQLSATAPVQLAQETRAGELGLLVFAPVRRSAGSGEVRGFALVVLRIRDFVSPAFATLGAEGLSVTVRDVAHPALTLFGSAAADGGGSEISPIRSPISQRRRIELAGRTWELAFTAAPSFVRRQSSLEPILYPLAALALTVLLAAFTAREETRKRSFEWLEERVRARTKELAEANQQLSAEVAIRKQAQEDAAQARDAQTQFLANLSHEIRTPLNAIIGYSQILQRYDIHAALHREALIAIVEGGHHLLSLVDEVIDLSKIESGHLQLSAADFDLGAVISGLSYMFRQKCERKGLRLRVEGLGSAPQWVRGDEGKLRQVLINLLGNALKFTERGEVRLRVVPDAENEFRFEVIDTGIGIAENDQARVFGDFYQAETSRASEGAGLGLAISRRLVALMGGALELRSTSGWGSNFHFTLAFERPLAVVASQANAQHPRIRLAAGTRCRVLVVDDLEQNRNVLCHMLTAIGCEVASARSGEDALAIVPEWQPALIFLDVWMPGLDGIETARALRLTAAGAALKIVAFSASALETQRAHYLASGFDAFMPKPFRIERINDCLVQLLGVEFVAEAEPPVDPAPGPVELPAQLLEQLREAAESYQVTKLRQLFEQLEQGGAAHAALADKLRASAARYDMPSLIAQLGGLCRDGGYAA